MFSLNTVTLRPLEFEDIPLLYTWDLDHELNMLSGWSPRRSRAAFQQIYEQRITNPSENMATFGIQFDERLIGFVQLALIDLEEKRAAVGILIGEKQLWGRGIGKTALQILLDYAFTVRGLERVYAEIYSFNTRSFRLMEQVGFQREGILRQHEIHNGVRQDMHVFGLLKTEFYTHHETIFRIPGAHAPKQ
ncbi:GNAT family N-acetyltransferase [Tengunoibacter tsumagoiensis]|uniref:Acetyltransferase n=1 Tax=Tengunoibacter tsumagoiensis TaxID=2014871 RepID=A0A402A802_9CHLR|nr:GNAT family protein [Tengunoibacter tsumagoiensis]GCE15209.1 acetyltransferase [Tengunoibacter tsumagoiensis]